MATAGTTKERTLNPGVGEAEGKLQKHYRDLYCPLRIGEKHGP